MDKHLNLGITDFGKKSLKKHPDGNNHSWLSMGDVILFHGRSATVKNTTKTLTIGQAYIVEYAWRHGIQVKNNNGRIITIGELRNFTLIQDNPDARKLPAVLELLKKEKLRKFLTE